MIEGLLVIIGVSCGAIVSVGLFSLIISLGIISKFADRTHTGNQTTWYELAVMLGGIVGNLIWIYRLEFIIPIFLQVVIAGAAGIFVGCWAMAIAEVINIFPIFIRKAKIKGYLPYVILSIAMGKGLGALFIFWKGFGK